MSQNLLRISLSCIPISVQMHCTVFIAQTYSNMKWFQLDMKLQTHEFWEGSELAKIISY